jgi:phage terminase Nu1 subunit (DNA packaging protein)
MPEESEPPKRRRGERIQTPATQALAESRTLLTDARRKAVEFKLARERSEVIETRLAQLQASFLFIAMRQKLLAIPSAYCRRLLNISDTG